MPDPACQGKAMQTKGEHEKSKSVQPANAVKQNQWYLRSRVLPSTIPLALNQLCQIEITVEDVIS